MSNATTTTATTITILAPRDLTARPVFNPCYSSRGDSARIPNYPRSTTRCANRMRSVSLCLSARCTHFSAESFRAFYLQDLFYEMANGKDTVREREARRERKGRGGRWTRRNERNRFPNANARRASPILISADDSLIKMLVAFLLQVRIDEEAFSVERGGSARIAHLIGESTDAEKAGNEKFEIKATPFRTRVRSLAFARQMTLLITDSSITCIAPCRSRRASGLGGRRGRGEKKNYRSGGKCREIGRRDRRLESSDRGGQEAFVFLFAGGRNRRRISLARSVLPEKPFDVSTTDEIVTQRN